MNNDVNDYVRQLVDCITQEDEGQALRELGALLQELEDHGLTQAVINQPISSYLSTFTYGFTYKGYTAAHFLAREGKIGQLALLLQAGANPNSRNYISNTPLHVAVYYKQTRAIQALLQNHADPNLANDNAGHGFYDATYGETPIHYAASYGTRDSLDLLVKNDGDLTRVTGAGQSASSLALQRLAAANDAEVQAIIDFIEAYDHTQQVDNLTRIVADWKFHDETLDKQYAELSTYDVSHQAKYEELYLRYRDCYRFVLNPKEAAFNPAQNESFSEDEEYAKETIAEIKAAIQKLKVQYDKTLPSQLGALNLLITHRNEVPLPAIVPLSLEAAFKAEGARLEKQTLTYLQQLQTSLVAKRQRLVISIKLLENKARFYHEIARRASECRLQLRNFVNRYRPLNRANPSKLSLEDCKLTAFPAEVAYAFLRQLKPLYIELTTLLFQAKGELNDQWLEDTLLWLNEVLSTVDTLANRMEEIKHTADEHRKHLPSITNPKEQAIVERLVILCDEIKAAQQKLQGGEPEPEPAPAQVRPGLFRPAAQAAAADEPEEEVQEQAAPQLH